MVPPELPSDAVQQTSKKPTKFYIRSGEIRWVGHAVNHIDALFAALGKALLRAIKEKKCLPAGADTFISEVGWGDGMTVEEMKEFHKGDLVTQTVPFLLQLCTMMNIRPGIDFPIAPPPNANSNEGGYSDGYPESEFE